MDQDPKMITLYVISPFLPESFFTCQLLKPIQDVWVNKVCNIMTITYLSMTKKKRFIGESIRLNIHISSCNFVQYGYEPETAVLLTFLNVQIALFSALAVSYSVMILHAGFRKLTPLKKPSRGRADCLVTKF